MDVGEVAESGRACLEGSPSVELLTSAVMSRLSLFPIQPPFPALHNHAAQQNKPEPLCGMHALISLKGTSMPM